VTAFLSQVQLMLRPSMVPDVRTGLPSGVRDENRSVSLPE
jgi:hypothetical protein